MGKKREIFAIITSALLIGTFVAPPALASEFVRVSGTVVAPGGFVLESARIIVNGEFVTASGQGGSYEAVVPKSTQLRFAFTAVIAHSSLQAGAGISTFSNWESRRTFGGNTTLNFNIPEPKKVTLRFVDANNSPLSQASFYEVNGNQLHNPSIQSDGTTWTGIQRLVERKRPAGGTPYALNGEADVWLFETDSHWGFRYEERNVPGPQIQSGTFKVPGESLLKFCVPVRFGADLSLPKDCFPTASDQAKAAADSSAKSNRIQCTNINTKKTRNFKAKKCPKGFRLSRG